MEAMAEFPDKFFELAIVDPPYGLGNRLSDGGGKLKNTPMSVLYKNSNKWDSSTPDESYFEELFRVSKHQIIWGGNYFKLPPSRCMICWDKKQDMPTLSAWELGWSSFDKPSKIFECVSTDLSRFHPTQKPIALYKWLLQNYAKPGDKILDTHLGSGSSRIAAYDMGFDFWGYELDADYFEAMEKRFKTHISKPTLFAPEQMYHFEQTALDL
jgi:site-specific DNA-methyltransferase (adenine-specific)